MVSSRPVGGGTTDRDRPNERASERATAAPTDDGGGSGAGKWDFKLFAVLAIDAVVGTVGREKPEPTERGRRARSAKREREGGKEWYRLSSLNFRDVFKPRQRKFQSL